MSLHTESSSPATWISHKNMNKSILPFSTSSMLLVAGALSLLAAEPATPKLPFTTPLQWKSSGVLVMPVSDATHEIVSVKDPTIVRYNDLWHIYATVIPRRPRPGAWCI